MAGYGPVPTSPVYGTDEELWIRSRGDYGTLANSSEQLAYGTDGVITSGSPWTMTSASVDFQGQGVVAQNVVQLTGPKSQLPGSGRFFAVDSVSPNTVNLRVIGKSAGVGQPPAASTGATSITFTINTFQTLLEDASWDLKSRLAIDESQSFRASPWIYNYGGLEDPYRDLRAACVLQALMKLYQAEVREGKGDWALKLQRVSNEYREVFERVQVRWGIFGNSEEPTSIFSCKVSR